MISGELTLVWRANLLFVTSKASVTVERKRGRKQIACKDVTVSLSFVYESEYGYCDLEETYLRIVVKNVLGIEREASVMIVGKAEKKRMACKDAPVSLFVFTIVCDMRR